LRPRLDSGRSKSATLGLSHADLAWRSKISRFGTD
jgi:hypothetical protein